MFVLAKLVVVVLVPIDNETATMATNRGEPRRRPEVHVAELLRRSNEDDNRRSSSLASATVQYRSADLVLPGILSRKRQAAGLCLAALVVLAADTRKGWALDSYGNYSQFQYLEATNVIGFVYSVLQFAVLVGLMRKNKHLESYPKRDLFDFIMDQITNRGRVPDQECVSQGGLFHMDSVVSMTTQALLNGVLI